MDPLAVTGFFRFAHNLHIMEVLWMQENPEAPTVEG